jgi:hypothetical protein
MILFSVEFRLSAVFWEAVNSWSFRCWLAAWRVARSPEMS